MSATNQLIALPEALLQQAANQASHLGERIRLENADAEYFRARAARASGRPLGEILDQGRDNPPDPGDEL